MNSFERRVPRQDKFGHLRLKCNLCALERVPPRCSPILLVQDKSAPLTVEHVLPQVRAGRAAWGPWWLRPEPADAHLAHAFTLRTLTRANSARRWRQTLKAAARQRLASGAPLGPRRSASAG